MPPLRHALLCLLATSSLLAAEPPSDQLAFFEKKIRPVLVEHCYKCHSAAAESAKQLKGGLLVDSRDGLLRGGDSGPAIVPGKPEESLLIDALKFDGLQMPPKGKLPDAVIADFVSWVKNGAVDPRQSATVKRIGIDLEAGRKHWAYQPPKRIAPPPVKDREWSRGEIDSFILAGLETKSLRPVADADRIALVRRLYFDLVGLPPTPEQIDEFVSDSSPDAYERLVDRLLAAPQFGERWGRHWLDVARYAESLTLRGFILHSAWRYRDYVIETLNQDRPFDQFVREQIAGDLLPAASPADRRRNLIATTYLALGNTNLEEQDKALLRMDVVDEQLETIGKGLLAQTLGCSRCHDHKFDPIPTRDYYALAGILRSTKTLEHSNVSNWLEIPLPVEPEHEAVFQRHEAAVNALKEQIKLVKASAMPKKTVPAPTVKSPAIIAVKDLPGVVVDDSHAKKVGEWQTSQYSKRYIGDGYVHDQAGGKGEKTLTFLPELPAAGRYEVRFAYSEGASRSAAVPVTVFSADGEKTIHIDQREPPPLDGHFISLGQFRFEQNGQGFVIVSNEDTKGHVTADAVQFLPVEQLEAQTKPAADSDAQVKQLEAELKKLTDSGPKRPVAIAVREESTIEDVRVHIRGSVSNLGDRIPRGFLQVATTGPLPTLSVRESGRRELAEWLADEQNPLTARVFANRVWHWLIGRGLVRTTDNFGTTGEMPSHPELLDQLTLRFVDSGWSVKTIVRDVVLSRTYRLSSAADARLLAADPENQLVGRANRRRLEAECLLDAIQSVSGQLQFDLGGPNVKVGTIVDFGYQHGSPRRAVYWPVFRNALPELFDVFDAADPSMVTGRRNVSTVAPQALFLMNHPFVLAQSRATAARLLAESHPDDDSQLDRLYRLALGRKPSANERQLARQFLTETPSRSAADRWALLVQTVLASVDFRYQM